MTTPQKQQHDDDSKSWASRSRDGVILVLAASMLIFETVGSLLGRPADSIIVGAAVALLGLREITR